MTNILITHNPFLIETEIIIDGIAIAATSGLYKYIKTPMQDWVNDFLPTLIEHCNDDELNITFRGLRHNYDDLETELEAFLKKNRDCDIELHFDSCKSQIARLGAIDSILDEIKTQSLVPELCAPEFWNKLTEVRKDELQALVFGGSDKQRSEFTDDLLGMAIPRSETDIAYCCVDDDSVDGLCQGDMVEHFQEFRANIPFVSSKFCQMMLYEIPNLNMCKNVYFRFVKKAITSDDKPILICIVDEDNRNNNAEILNLVSDAYKIRGKQNKWRFIFIAENPQYAKRTLNSEFAIKNADVFALDDILSIRRKIEEYQCEVCLVRHVSQQSESMSSYLSELENKITNQAELSKKSEEIDILENDALSLIKDCNIQPVFPSRESIKSSFNTFFNLIEKEYKEHCFPKKENYESMVKVLEAVWYPAFSIYNIKSRVSEYMEKLAAKIKTQLEIQGQNFYWETSLLIPDGLIEILRQLDCSMALQYLGDNTETQRNTIPAKKCPPTAVYRGKISDHVKSTQTWTLDRISENGYFTSKLYYTCVQEFINLRTRIEEIFVQYYNACAERGDDEFCEELTKFDTTLKGIEQEIKTRAEEMRKAAQISEVEQKRLTYIQKLQKQVQELTCL